MLYLKVNKKPFICKYCNHGYTKESTLITHICEQKRRHLAKNEKHVLLAFQTFARFFQITQNSNQGKTYEDFAKSPYYNAFVKFGSYISNVNPLYPDQYIDWVVKSGVKLDHWCKDELYEKYVLELIQTESSSTALQRTIKNMELWANDNNSQWNHYFKYVNINRGFFDIKDGKISPWLLLNCSSGKNLLNQFDDYQLQALAIIINPEFWIKKFKKYKDDLELISDIVKQGNL